MGCKRRRPTAVASRAMFRASIALAVAALTLTTTTTDAASSALPAANGAAGMRWRAVTASDVEARLLPEAGVMADGEEREGSGSASAGSPAPPPSEPTAAPPAAPEPTTPVEPTQAPTQAPSIPAPTEALVTEAPNPTPADETGSDSAPTPTANTPAPTTQAPTAPTSTAPSSPPPPTTVTPTPTVTPVVTPPAPPPAPPAPPAPTPAPPTPTTPTPTVTPPPPTPATKPPAPTPSTAAPPNTSSGNPGDQTPPPTPQGNGEVSAPDLDLSPIAGSGIIGKSNKDDDSSGLGASTSSASDGKLSTVSVVLIVASVVGIVIAAVFFVHVKRRRDGDKDTNNSSRQRELDAFFSYHNAPIPRTNHPGAASLVSSNGMTVAPPPLPLTPRSQIPIASSSRFKQEDITLPRFSDSVMEQGPTIKGRMASIPASPHNGGHSSDFDANSDVDSFLGVELLISDHSSQKRQGSNRSGYSIHSSSTDRQSPSTHATQQAADAPMSSFPRGLTDSRSAMVQMGLVSAEHPIRDDESTTFSIDDTDTGRTNVWDNRPDRGDSNVSSISNPNPWDFLGPDSNRGVSSVSSQSTDLPSIRSTDSYTSMSSGYRTTNEEALFTDDSSGRGRRSGSYPTYGTPNTDTEVRGQRVESYPSYGTPRTDSEVRGDRVDSYRGGTEVGTGSNRSMLSFSSYGTEERPSRASSELLEGSI